MSEEEEKLEQYKQIFISSYIDASIDRLLCLRSKVKNATNIKDIILAAKGELG